MSGLTEADFLARDAARLARATELAPKLAHVLTTAKEVYEELRPHALHVSDAPKDSPLRHQQVNAFALEGVQLVPVTDYIMIALDEDQGLTITQDNSNPFETTWRLERYIRLGELASQRTVVEQAGRQDLGKPFAASLDVATYTYPNVYGQNARINASLSHMFNQYDGAEQHLEDVETDLTDAILRYGQ